MRSHLILCSLLFSASLATGQTINQQVAGTGGTSLAVTSSRVTAALPVGAEAPTLQWELVNPFRFIRDKGLIDELKSVYDQLPRDDNGKRSAYDLERELQKRADALVKRNREEARTQFNCDDPRTALAKQKCFEPYLGWFAKLAQNHHEGTCWDSKAHRFRDDEPECADYIHPKKHKVRVWISNTEQFNGRMPRWFVNGEPINAYQLCAEKLNKGACVEFDIDYDESRDQQISAKFAERDLVVEPIAVRVMDRLIVGLGDSYAAGEGNPDIPAKFTQQEKELDLLFGPILAPQKDKDSRVAWLDERCHRSMYSYQFKTALNLALSNPKQAVTYVSYSCAGAKTEHILDKEQKPNEGEGKLKRQLEALRQVLSDGTSSRPIDYLLLSIGGNDIGFAKYVAYVVLSGLPLRLFSRSIHVGELGNNPSKFTKMLLESSTVKPANYPRLHSALLAADTGVTIKGCSPGAPCARVLLTPYPNIFENESGAICKADRGEFDTSFGKDRHREERIALIKQTVLDPLQEIQRSPIITSRFGWTVVRAHMAAFLGHGFCAQDNQSGSLTGEKFILPTWKDGGWQSFDPREYRAYEVRRRWIRLPVDSKLTTDQVHVLPLGFTRIRIDIAKEDDRSNIMHPTAEAHAKIADANLAEIDRLESAIDR